MTQADGIGAWWNHFGDPSLPKMVERVKQLGPNGFVITKAHFPVIFAMFKAAGIRQGIERYVYPQTPSAEAHSLAKGIEDGATFAVINAEVEWESLGREPMEQLIRAFRVRCPNTELFASVDTRGYRFDRPYQRVLAEHVAGWMPMIYPKSFLQTAHQAFESCLTGKDFKGVPVYPTIQTYEGVGALLVGNQLEEVRARSLPGCQAYTVAHATDEEWAAVVRAVPPEQEDDDDMTFLRWLHWDAHAPGTAKFRSYRVYMGPSGPIKVTDVGAAEFNATAAATGYAIPAAVPLALLKAIKSAPGTPEPDAA